LAKHLAARFALLALLFILALVVPACARSDADLTVAGSTSVQPFAELLAEEYMREHAGAVINIQGGGSSAGIQAVTSGAAEMGMSSRALRPAEEELLEEIVIALDAIAIIVHPSNPVEELTMGQLRQLFAGELAGWQDLGGNARRFTLVTREEGSGTRGAYQELVMGEVDIDPGAIVQDSNGAVRQVVSDDPNAVGYISLGLVNERVKAINIGGVEPSNENVTRGTYSLVRPFLYVVQGTPTESTQAFITYTLSPEGQAVLASEGLVPVH
jgi:phosphate transport system substrate-binding protein